MECLREMIYTMKSCLFIVLFISLTDVVMGQQEVWTYDFGTETRVHNSGESTSFLPDLQSNGGMARVRIGSGEGAISLEKSDIGTFSGLNLQAANNKSDVLFQISGFNSSNLFYVRFSMRLTGGNSGTFGFLFGNGTSFMENVGYVGDSFSGFRSALQSDGTVLTERRTSTTWSDAFDIGPIFKKDQTHTVEIYVNNSASEMAYFRNGGEKTLASRDWALWVDGVNFDDFGSVGLAAGDAIDGFLFFGQSSEGNTAYLEIDDLTYSNSLPDIRRIEGFTNYSGDGEWRMLSLPYDVTVEQLARQTLVQGVAGSFPDAGSNIFTSHHGNSDEMSQDADWIAPTDLSDTIQRGQGFIWLLYDNALIPENKPLPLDLTIASANDNMTDLNVPLSSASDGWNLLGNPFREDLRVDNIENWESTGGSLVSSVAQVYDPESNSYVVLNQAEDKVAAFQGFFLQNGSASNITIPSTARSSGATFYKDLSRSGLISLKVQSDQNSKESVFTDRAIELFFASSAEHGWDLLDASKLTPLSSTYLGLGFVGKHQGVRVLKAQDSRPYTLNEPITIPLEFFSAGLDGSAELSVQRRKNIPAGWRVEVEDTYTGKRQMIDENQPFYFDFSATLPPKILSKRVQTPPTIQSAKKSADTPRFLVHVNPDPNLSSRVPATFILHQNYPNPFNPTTNIRFSLSENSRVNLSVYNMMGRKIKTLLNETMPAGTHQVEFNANRLSSGTYMYRLRAGGKIRTNKLTLIK